MTKRLCVIAMIGGIDLIGELDVDMGGDVARLYRPSRVRMPNPNQVQLIDMLRNSPCLTGIFIELNMLSVLWIAEPNHTLSSAYQAARSGLMPAGSTVMPAAVNQ